MATITGTGHHVPERVVTNEELAPKIGSTPEWIEERTGIRERRWVEEGETNSGLAHEATKRALDDAGMRADELDALIFATLSPDAGFPGSGVFLQRLLDVPGIPALDVRNQCSGFLYALSIANSWVDGGVYENVLVVGSEVHSTGLDISERGRAVTSLFGDGAGAAIVQPGDRIRDIRLGADGSGIEALWCELPASGLHPNLSHAYLDAGRHYPQMQGRTVLRRAVETLERELKQLIEDHELDRDELVFVPHQANKHISEMVAKRLKLAPDQIESTIERYANTTAASIPITLDEARRAGTITRGSKVVFGAFGSGFTWASALIEF